MTDKERCDKCEFYEGPPQSDEKGVVNSVKQLTYGKPKDTPPDNANLGTCRAAPPYSRLGKKKWPKVDADDWCGMFKERSRGTEGRARG